MKLFKTEKCNYHNCIRRSKYIVIGTHYNKEDEEFQIYVCKKHMNHLLECSNVGEVIKIREQRKKVEEEDMRDLGLI